MTASDLFPETAAAHDPGGKTLPMMPGMSGEARFTGANDEHRLWLRRWWGRPPGGPYMLSIGMNPSTASHLVDDATIRRDIHFAQREGMDGFYKVNACSYRATEPAELARQGDNATHPENINTIVRLAGGAKLILVCYGVLPKIMRHHGEAALRALRQEGVPLYCLGKTAAGHPKHPLYLKGDTPLEKF